MNDKLEPGGYILKTCELSNYDGTKKVDIGDLVTGIEIKEDISQINIQGFVTILDSVNLIDDLPIIGEETLTLEFEDFFEGVTKYEFHVSGVDTLGTNNTGTFQAYVLRLQSKDFIKSESIEISQSFKNAKISDFVKTIYDEYFISNKDIEIEETFNEGDQIFVVPGLTPFETIILLSGKSFSDVNQSSNFLFFERKDKYMFCTHEKLFEDGKDTTKVYNYSAVNADINDRASMMYKIINFSLNKRANLISEMRSGSAISRTIKLDLGTKTFENVVYKHYDKIKDYKHSDDKIKNYHSEKFNQDFFGDDNITNDYFVFYDSTRTDQQYQDIISPRLSTSYYLNSITMYIELHGEKDINIGDMIRLNIKDLSHKNDGSHKTLTGLYLVSSINSVFDGNTWKMTLGLLKDGLNDGDTE